MQSLQAVASLIGRIMLAGIFVISGTGKIAAPATYEKIMTSAGMPYAGFFLVCAIIVELGGGLLVLTGWKARAAALVLFLFLIPVTLTFHLHQKVEFLKNTAIMGGLLMVVAFGPGPISLGGRGAAAGRSKSLPRS